MFYYKEDSVKSYRCFTGQLCHGNMWYLCDDFVTGRLEMRSIMEKYKEYVKELEKFANGKSKYAWDELEEIITDDFEEERLTSEQFDKLMETLMELDCEE